MRKSSSCRRHQSSSRLSTSPTSSTSVVSTTTRALRRVAIVCSRLFILGQKKSECVRRQRVKRFQVACSLSVCRSVVQETWQLVRFARIRCDTSLPTRRRRSSDTGGPLVDAGDAGCGPSSSSSTSPAVIAAESSCRRACVSSSRNMPLMLTSSFADTCVYTHAGTVSHSRNCCLGWG